METKKLPHQPISLKGELKDFIYISPIIPSSSSFFVSFGISLLESLIRLKCCPELEIQTWNCIKSLPLEDLSKKVQLKSFFTSFKTLVTTLEISTRKDSTIYLSQTIENQISTIDFGIRLLICYFTKNPSILKGKVRNFDLIIPLLVKHLKISVFLIINNRYKVYKITDGVPVVCLFCNNTNYSVLYHRATKYVDEKPDPVHFDPSQFPFTNSSLSVQIPAASTPLIELINFLASQVHSLSPELQAQLKSKISDLPEEHFQISQLPSITCLVDTKSCSHNVSSILGTCGKLHCGECIKYWSKCPCGHSGFPFGKPRARSVSKTRHKAENIICFDCQKSYDSSMYSFVSVQGHNICNNCRNLKIKGDANLSKLLP